MSTNLATSTGKYPMFFFFLGYSDMNSEEQKSLEDFFKAKSIRIKNEMAEEVCELCFPGVFIQMLIIS